MNDLKNSYEKIKKEIFLFGEIIEKYEKNMKINEINMKINEINMKINEIKHHKKEPAGHKIPIVNNTNLKFQNSLRN